MGIIKSIAFFGGSKISQDDQTYKDAFQTAKLVAQSGRRIINGGGPGVMMAATLGAREADGKTAVVYYKPELATSFEGKAALNFADESTEESNYIDRTKKLLEMGDIYIIFNGATGTISEFGLAWGIGKLYFGHHKPLILYGDFWREIIGAFKKNMQISEREFKIISVVNSPQEALFAIEAYEQILKDTKHDHTTCDGKECSLLL